MSTMRSKLNWLVDKLDKAANTRTLLITFGLFVLLTLSFQGVAWLTKPVLGGAPAPSLDGRLLGYTPDEAHDLLRAYGDSGRRVYAIIALTLDLVYPVTYSLFMSLVLVRGSRNRPALASFLRPFALVPFIGMLADYSENISVLAMIARYSDTEPSTTLATVANIFTLTKWGIAGGCALVVVLVLVAGCESE